MKIQDSTCYRIYIQGMVPKECSLLIFLSIFAFCGEKNITHVSKTKVICPDSVFYELELADLNKLCVKVLKLREHNLSEFPKGVINYSNIAYLDLAMNKIDSIPDEICRLEKLESLVLSYGTIKHLPPCIKDLSNLKNLDILDNDLEILPETIGYLSSLERLNLKGNKIRSIPKSIAHLKNLRFLSISGPDGECLLSPADKEFILSNLSQCDIRLGRTSK